MRVAQNSGRDYVPGVVLVQTARTKYHRRSGLNNLFLTVPETEKSKMRVLA